MAKVLEFQFQHQSFQWIFRKWFPLGLTRLITFQSKEPPKVFSNIRVQKHQFFGAQLSLESNSHIHPKTITLTRWTFVGRVMSLLFNMLSRLVKAFLPRSKRVLISWLHSLSAVILEPKKIKVCHCFDFFPICFPWSDGIICYDLHFLNVEF